MKILSSYVDKLVKIRYNISVDWTLHIEKGPIV